MRIKLQQKRIHHYTFLFFLAICFVTNIFAQKKINKLPVGFAYVKEIIPSIQVDLRYCYSNNFVGSSINGYVEPRCILTKKATLALKKAQTEFKKLGYGILVFDGYRPQRAVNHFVRWSKVIGDTITKNKFYPKLKKRDLFALEYIASKSGHSRGSTLDITLVKLYAGKQVDMGSPYDFFGEQSWVNFKDINDKKKSNRKLLQDIMNKNGFISYAKEWWHFTLKNEPFPNQYFDFTIK